MAKFLPNGLSSFISTPRNSTSSQIGATSPTYSHMLTVTLDSAMLSDVGEARSVPSLEKATCTNITMPCTPMPSTMNINAQRGCMRPPPYWLMWPS